MRSTQQHNPVVEMVQYQLEASIHLAEAVFSGTEKIDRAMLDVTHQAMDGQLKLVRAVASMRDPSRMAELQSSLASRPEKTMHCQQQIMSALVEIQAEFGKSIRNSLERFSQVSADQAAETAHEHSAGAGRNEGKDAPLNPFTGMLSVWEEAFKEASRLASQNLMVARNSMENTTSAMREAASQHYEASHVDTHHQAAPRAKKQARARRKS